MHAHPGGVKEVVGAGSLDDLSLLLHGEILPGELGVHIGLVQLHDLVVADRPRVGIVHDACQPALCLRTDEKCIVSNPAELLVPQAKNICHSMLL